MGTGISRADRNRLRHLEIEKALAEETRERRKHRTINILLLGTSGCGKSTIFKQMRILHMDGFNAFYLGHYRSLIHTNIVEAMEQLIDACHNFRLILDFSLQRRVTEFKEFCAANKSMHELNPEIANIIYTLWRSPKIQHCYERRDFFELQDSAKFFLDRVLAIADVHYRPATDDILHARIVTTGAVSVEFAFKNTVLRMTDVGGSRSEMKKWIHFFEGVDTVLFVAAISEYDQNYTEERCTPQMKKMLRCMNVFGSVVSNHIFARTAFLLFLNKTDIFKDKLDRIPLNICFPEYYGANNYDDCKDYVHNLFVERATMVRRLYTHFTVATDTKNVDRVFTVCMDVIIEENMKESGFA